MSEVNYPGGIHPKGELPRKNPAKKKRTLKIAAGNRGMSFETELNDTNAYYKEKGLAIFNKRPTPINIVKVDYSRGAKITEAYFETQSTTDYNGVYKGRYIDFEAKSIHGKTSLPLANIPPQQIAHLKSVLEHGGIGFFLVDIVPLQKVYLLPASYVIDFYEKRERASIPVNEFPLHGKEVPQKYRPRYDFLPLIDELFLK